MRILIICTGNSCRSKMAEGFLKSLDKNLEVHSAGTLPENEVNPIAVRVMKEAGIDIGNTKPEPIEKYLNDRWDFVITVCDAANETCPVFNGKVNQRIHFGFADPSKVSGSEEYVISEFRKTRDDIKKEFREFYETFISGYEK